MTQWPPCPKCGTRNRPRLLRTFKEEFDGTNALIAAHARALAIIAKHRQSMLDTLPEDVFREIDEALRSAWARPY